MLKKLLISSAILASSLFAQGDRFTQIVKVNYSKPVYETIEEVIPHKHDSHCYEEYQVKTPRYSNNRSYKDENSIGVDTIIGATAGVIIGNQIGRGNGRDAAKIIGGILGATVANSMRNYEKIDDYSSNSDYYYETKRRNLCKNRNSKIISKNILKGYENYFTYHGVSYSKFSEYKMSHVEVTNKISF